MMSDAGVIGQGAGGESIVVCGVECTWFVKSTVCKGDHDRLQEAVPWIDAVVNATAEAGFECGLRVYQDGTYTWWPTDGSDPHGGEHFGVFHKAVTLCEPLRPAWVQLSLFAQRQG